MFNRDFADQTRACSKSVLGGKIRPVMFRLSDQSVAIECSRDAVRDAE